MVGISAHGVVDSMDVDAAPVKPGLQLSAADAALHCLANIASGSSVNKKRLSEVFMLCSSLLYSQYRKDSCSPDAGALLVSNC